MKKYIVCTLALLLCLSACHKAPTGSWVVGTEPSTEHTDMSPAELCASYAAVQAKFWQREAGQWQLSIIEAPEFVVAIYIADQTYEIKALTMDDMKAALSEYPCSSEVEGILAEEPYLWFANTNVVNPDEDGWGTKKVLTYELPWPAKATDDGTGWHTDDVSFQVTSVSNQDSAEEDLKAMVETLEQSDVPSASILYYQDSTYQGLAFCLDGLWDISLARFDNEGSIYLALVQQPDFDKALELADRYSMKMGMQALEVVEPYYSK